MELAEGSFAKRLFLRPDELNLNRTSPETRLITIHVNGEKKEIPNGLKLGALLEWLKLPGDRVAVEHNLEIVPRNLWHATAVHDGDRLEVVHFVGGGWDF